MASNKRRKIDKLTDPPASISAIAARKQKQLQIVVDSTDIDSTSSELAVSAIPRDPELFDSTLIKNLHNVSQTFQSTGPEANVSGNATHSSANMSDTSGYSQEEEVKFITKGHSREDEGIPVLGPPAVQLTTMKPNKSNVKELQRGVLYVKLAAGERLVLLGQYGLSVIKGQVTILGATLSASESVHRIYALASHSLPVIRCSSDSDGAEIKLHQSDTKLRALKRLSPLFSRLCNDGSSIFIKDQGLEGALGSLKRRKSSFQILFSTGAGPQKLFVCPMTSPPEWNEMLSRLSSLESKQAKPKIAMICGPKSSGKSTFTRLLTNYFLTKQISRSQKRQAGVAILDLDPGQPEFSPPGQLTLVHLLKPNFGPPYSHTVALKGARRIIRAHSIGSVSPAADPVLYSSCLRDLLRHYHELLRSIPECPLIINTPGWVLGTGLELLVDIIKLARPTDVIYMSQEGPLDVVTTLESAIKPRPFYALPSQLSEYTTRSAANLRTMQMMSYFHTEEDKNGLKWNATPLTSVAPLEVQYNGQAAGILGIMCIGEQPPPEMLISTINGNILAVVVIDDTAAIPGWPGDGHDHSMDNSGTREERHALAAASTRTLQRPLIIKTREGLPYFNPANAIVLDPRFSHSVGLALVRGIDTNRHKLQLITPISPEIINDIRNSEKYIVLVSGKLDTPGWAYTEELNRRTALAKSRRKLAAVSSEDENSGESGSVNDDDDNETSGSTSGDEAADDGEGGKEGDEFENIPWIEKIHGHEGRGPGARVWRVRRDLGRNGNGD